VARGAAVEADYRTVKGKSLTLATIENLDQEIRLAFEPGTAYETAALPLSYTGIFQPLVRSRGFEPLAPFTL
jgi:hypothetical protein